MNAAPEANVSEPISATPTPEKGAQADLGILLVHGIGEQAQGETLLQFAEPIIEWIRIWLRHDAVRNNLSKYTPIVSKDLKVSESEAKDVPRSYLANDTFIALTPFSAQLKAPLLEVGTPAYARVVVGTQKRGKGQAEEWLFAEAWWGHQVYSPSIANFTVWLLTRGPWLMLFHFYQKWVFDRESKWQKIAMGSLVMLGWLPLSLLFNMFLLATSLIALIPIGWVRSTVKRSLLKATGVLGDAYVQIRSPMQRAAFTDATLKAMQWLRPRSKRVAIVAHSQGAAVALEALQRPDAPGAERLITVGAGIAKLEALRFFEKQDATYRVSAMLASPFIVLAIVVWLRTWQLGLEDDSTRYAGPIFLTLIGLQFLYNACTPVLRALEHLRAMEISFGPQQRNLEWCDIVATRDPVPAGNLDKYFSQVKKVESKSVAISNSIFSDHTGYWQARAKFLPEMVSQLGQTSEGKMLALDTRDSRFAAADKAYKIDLGVLRFSRWADVLAFLVLPLIFSHEKLFQLAGAFRERLIQVEVIKKLQEGLRLITASPEAVLNFLLLFSALSSMLWLWRKIAFPLWQIWSANRIDDAFGKQHSEHQLIAAPVKVQQRLQDAIQFLESNLGAIFISIGFISILLLPLFLSGAWNYFPHIASEKNLYVLLGAISILPVIVFLVLALTVHFLDKIIKAIDRIEALFKRGDSRG